MVRLDAEDELPRLVDVYQLYNDDKLQEFVEAADTLLEHGAPSRHDTIQLLIFLGNCAEDSLDTLNYLQRAQSEYRFWQVNHEYDDIPALEDLAPKLEILRGIVEKERLDWEKEQQEEVDRELEALGHNVRDPDHMLEEAADMEEDEDAVDSDAKEALTQAGNLVYRPKNKPGEVPG